MVAPYPFGCLRGDLQSPLHILRFPFWFLVELSKASAFWWEIPIPINNCISNSGEEIYLSPRNSGVAARLALLTDRDAGPRHLIRLRENAAAWLSLVVALLALA
jgi:hypothetical protein